MPHLVCIGLLVCFWHIMLKYMLKYITQSTHQLCSIKTIYVCFFFIILLLHSVQLQTSHIFWLRCDLFYQVGMKLIRKLHFIFHCGSINKIQLSVSCLMFL